MFALQWRLSAVILPDWIGDSVNWKYLSSSVPQKPPMKQICSCDCHSLLAPRSIRPHTCLHTASAAKHCYTGPVLFAVSKSLFDYLACLSCQLQFCFVYTDRAFLRTPFLNPAEVLTACLLLPGYSAVSFSHYSAQKYEIKCPRSAKALWELTSFSASPAAVYYARLSAAVIYLLY